MQVPKIAWTILACALLIWGLLNILTATGDQKVYEGVSNAPGMAKGVMFFIAGVTYFILMIVRRFKNKKAPD
jgi:cell division protein FtsW (lipid II flippase)